MYAKNIRKYPLGGRAQLTDWGLVEENLRLLSNPRVLANLAKLIEKKPEKQRRSERGVRRG